MTDKDDIKQRAFRYIDNERGEIVRNLSELVQIQGIASQRLIKARYEKFRRIGRYSSRISVAISRERREIQEYLSRRLEEKIK